MIFINSVNEFHKYRPIVDDLFRNYGQIFFHHPSSIQASLIQFKNVDFKLAIDTDNLIVSAFKRKKDTVWQCEFLGFPFLVSTNTSSSAIEKYIQDVKNFLEATTLYFPLVYKIDGARPIFAQNAFTALYDRLSSPIINGELKKETMWRRVVERYGSRAERQRKLFDSMLHVESFTGVDVSEYLTQVEKKSWKKIYNQDMLSRDNQIVYYSQIIKSGLAKVSFAFTEKKIPVAYRITVNVNNILYVLKWSYDEAFKKYSPGFYLLTIDLFSSVDDIKYEYIDLYGSPDKLKDLMQTEKLARVDVYWSENPKEVCLISQERLAHDTKVNYNYKSDHGVSYLFKNAKFGKISTQ